VVVIVAAAVMVAVIVQVVELMVVVIVGWGRFPRMDVVVMVSPYMVCVEGVRVIDDHTLSITIDAAKAYFLAKLTHPSAFVLDRNNVEGNPDWIRKPNGTGPFRLSEYEPGEVIRLTRNEFYHLGPPMLAEVKFILSGGDSLLMYENDEIHVTGIGLLNLEAILDPSNPLSQEVLQAPPSFNVTYVGMNASEPPFDDPKVRQAFNYAVDKVTLAHLLLEDLVAPAKGILPPQFPGYNPNLKGYDYDPEMALPPTGIIPRHTSTGCWTTTTSATMRCTTTTTTTTTTITKKKTRPTHTI